MLTVVFAVHFRKQEWHANLLTALDSISTRESPFTRLKWCCPRRQFQPTMIKCLLKFVILANGLTLLSSLVSLACRKILKNCRLFAHSPKLDINQSIKWITKKADNKNVRTDGEQTRVLFGRNSTLSDIFSVQKFIRSEHFCVERNCFSFLKLQVLKFFKISVTLTVYSDSIFNCHLSWIRPELWNISRKLWNSEINMIHLSIFHTYQLQNLVKRGM